jgi:hypothetical protein
VLEFTSPDSDIMAFYASRLLLLLLEQMNGKSKEDTNTKKLELEESPYRMISIKNINKRAVLLEEAGTREEDGNEE